MRKTLVIATAGLFGASLLGGCLPHGPSDDVSNNLPDGVELPEVNIPPIQLPDGHTPGVDFPDDFCHHFPQTPGCAVPAN